MPVNAPAAGSMPLEFGPATANARAPKCVAEDLTTEAPHHHMHSEDDDSSYTAANIGQCVRVSAVVVRLADYLYILSGRTKSTVATVHPSSAAIQLLFAVRRLREMSLCSRLQLANVDRGRGTIFPGYRTGWVPEAVWSPLLPPFLSPPFPLEAGPLTCKRKCVAFLYFYIQLYSPQDSQHQ